MDIKLIAFDLDGTVLNDDHLTLSERIKRALITAYNEGIYLIPTTGRLPSMVPDDVLMIPGVRYIIGANGAIVFDIEKNNILYSNYFSNDTVTQIIEILKKYRVPARIFSDNHCYMDVVSAKVFYNKDFQKGSSIIMDAVGRSIVVNDLHNLSWNYMPVCKISIPFLHNGCFDELWDIFKHTMNLEVTSSFPGNLEVTNKGVNKSSGLAFICSLFRISPQKVFSIGDGQNDIEMFRFSGVGVAMGNAPSNVKQAATYIAADHKYEGASKAIEHFILHVSDK